MEYIFYYIFEVMKFFIINRFGMKSEIRRKSIGIGAGLFVIGMSITMNFFEKNINPMLVYIPLVLAFTFLGFRYNRVKLFFITLWSICAVALIDVISATCILQIMNIANISNETMLPLCSSILTIVYLIVQFYIINKRYYGGLRKISLGYYVLFLIVCLINEVILAIADIHVEKDEYRMTVLFLLLALSAFIQMIIVLQLAVSSTVHREKEELNHKYLRQQEEHYEYLEQKEYETRKFRHDMRQHMHRLREFAYQGNMKDIIKYIETIFGILEKPESYVNLGNGIVDAIMNHYTELCKRDGVNIQVRGHMPLKCRIDPYDLCTIFSNFMQNALEACVKVENKIIKVVIRYDQNFIYIKSENTYNGKLLKSSDNLLTVKEEKEFHGYGISNMEDSIRKHKGEINYDAGEKRFTVMIKLPNHS